MQRITPCLWFDHQAEEAAHFYTSLFPNSKIGTVARYGESAAKASKQPKDSVMTVTFTLHGLDFMGLNGGAHFTFSPAVSLCVKCKAKDEIDTLWAAFSDGGTVLMPLDTYPFSEKFGWITDKYGLSWQLLLVDDTPGIAPLLMFVGDNAGKAEAAMNFYMAQFADTRVNHVSRYEEGDGDTVGLIKHASFMLDGQEMMLLESTGPHPFTLVQGISFIVNCRDQAEIDKFWDGLSKGGAPNVCGWLGDKYGLPWQVVPTEMGTIMKQNDPKKQERVMAALLNMKKLDIAALKRAADTA